MYKLIVGLVLSLICLQVPAIATPVTAELKTMSLEDLAATWNKQLPYMIDETTQMFEIKIKEESTLVFKFKILNLIAKQALTKEQSDKALVKIIAKVCSEPDIKVNFLDRGVSLEYIYYDKNLKQISDFLIHPEDCQQGE